jgi:DNA-binding CsgD family transcriptional regulator
MQDIATESAATTSAVSSEGFLLLDSLMNLIFINPAAEHILAYPQKPGTQRNVGGYLANKILSKLSSEQPLNGSALVPYFRSGRRSYRCRGFQVHCTSNGHSQVSVAVLLERAPVRPTSLVQLRAQFHLTNREQEVAQLLLEGLTSKEIGMRMQISPNTVKAFLRLIMVKMGVSTRSGVVGKALMTEL